MKPEVKKLLQANLLLSSAVRQDIKSRWSEFPNSKKEMLLKMLRAASEVQQPMLQHLVKQDDSFFKKFKSQLKQVSVRARKNKEIIEKQHDVSEEKELLSLLSDLR